MGYPDGLYVCSHKAEEHDEWAKDKTAFFRKRSRSPIPSQSQEQPAGKKLVMVDNIRKVLPTSQDLSPDQVEDFIKACSSLKE